MGRGKHNKVPFYKSPSGGASETGRPIPFVQVYADLMEHPSFCALTSGSMRLYFIMLLESKGRKEFELPYAVLRKKYGYRSDTTIAKSVKELENTGFITKISGKSNRTKTQYSFSSEWI